MLLALLLLMAGSGFAEEAELRILGVKPTVLFANQDPLSQIAKLELFNGSDRVIRCRVSVRIDGQPAGEIRSLEVPPGASSHRLLVLDMTSPAGLAVEITREPDARPLARYSTAWQPQRHWKVYVIRSSHEDLGYENFSYRKQREIANYIDLARSQSGPRDDSPSAGRGMSARYHYTLESLLFQRSYIEERSEAAWRDIVEKDIQTGRMHLMGAPSGVHSHWMDYEELARMTYPGRREARDRFGLDLKTFMIVDNPSLSWSGCQAVAEAGFRYVARWDMGWRTGGPDRSFARTRLPALFWWVAPDRKNRVLFAWRYTYSPDYHFAQMSSVNQPLAEAMAGRISQELQAIEDGTALGPYPYDALIAPEYRDHDIPYFRASFLQQWARKYRYPEIRIGNPTDFFEYMEEKYGPTLPVLSGDLNNFAADYATIDPESQGWKRRAARLLPLAEGMAAVASLLDPGFPSPTRLIERTFTRLFDYDEHSWPTAPRANDFQLFNAQWVKHQEGGRALEGAQSALEQSYAALAKHISTPDGDALVVFNPLGHARTDLVAAQTIFDRVIDPDTGKDLFTERLPGGQLVFVARDVPPFGYRVFRLRPGPTGAGPATSLSAGPHSLSNRYFHLELDPRTGAVRSVYDKELKRELVDSSAKHQFNQLVWVHKEQPPLYYQDAQPSPKDFVYAPAAASSMKGRAGRVQADFTVRIDDPKTGAAITQTAILYDELKRIDFVNELRHVRALHSDRHEDRYRENLYYAFPLRVDNFEARVEYAGGVVRPYTDQLRWGPHDYLLANRWVDLSNASYGVTMAPWNAATVSFGEILYNQFSLDYKPATSHLYSYAYSNRMAGLLTLNGDDCNATLRYSFTSHAGNWDSGATTRFGWSIASPLVARVLPAGQTGSLPEKQASFLSIDAPNVQLVTLKDSQQPGRGWIVRLIETEGKETTAKVDLPPFPISGAMECDLVENDRRPLPVKDRQVEVPIGPHAFATIRVFAEGGPLPAAAGPRGEAVSDKGVRLTWTGRTPATVGYNIYRSEDPGAPPTGYTLVARTTRPEFLDDWLKIDTPYYYHVAAVSRHNHQGPVSARIDVRTAKQNLSPPGPVQEVGVVRRAKDRLIVYWRTSPEPDVARYHIYRSEAKEFDPAGRQPVATVGPAPYFLQTYDDTGVRPGTTYYYRVLAEDWAGNLQTRSPLVSATTPAY